ncbi:hypothetical protein KBTX_04288 [wastewater metagenome]|uniref:Uncharacterized protein n=2 Tax=unclassified sequences TaxID=12908 RepID=A0A5B8RJN7_9ZZZZ|nr:hypothetical protein KBTEX_04288 [uncultured organism]
MSSASSSSRWRRVATFGFGSERRKRNSAFTAERTGRRRPKSGNTESVWSGARTSAERQSGGSEARR